MAGAWLWGGVPGHATGLVAGSRGSGVGGGLLVASWRSWDMGRISEAQPPTSLGWGALSLGPSPVEQAGEAGWL